MGLTDKVKDAARKAGEAVKEGAGELKEKGQEVTLKRKLNGLAEDLGRVYFRQREGESGLDAEVDRLVGEMRAVQTELDALDD